MSTRVDRVESFQVKPGMQSSHGEVVAVIGGDAHNSPAHSVICIAEQGPLGAQHCGQNDIAHWAHQRTGRWGLRVAVNPPLGQMQRFLPNVSTCH